MKAELDLILKNNLKIFFFKHKMKQILNRDQNKWSQWKFSFITTLNSFLLKSKFTKLFFPCDAGKTGGFFSSSFFYPIVRFNILIAGDGFRIPLRRDVLRNYVTIYWTALILSHGIHLVLIPWDTPSGTNNKIIFINKSRIYNSEEKREERRRWRQEYQCRASSIISLSTGVFWFSSWSVRQMERVCNARASLIIVK